MAPPLLVEEPSKVPRVDLEITFIVNGSAPVFNIKRIEGTTRIVQESTIVDVASCPRTDVNSSSILVGFVGFKNSSVDLGISVVVNGSAIPAPRSSKTIIQDEQVQRPGET